MRGTLGKERIRKAIQDVLRESPAAERLNAARSDALASSSGAGSKKSAGKKRRPRAAE